MATPTLKAVTPTTPEADLPFAPEPVVIYGLPEGGGDVEVGIADVTGLQSALDAKAATADLGDLATADSVAYADVTGKPSTFPPATHAHEIADVTGLQAIITDLTDRIAALETPEE